MATVELVELSPAPRSAPRRAVTTIRAYVGLTKPRIIELLLVTTVPSMVLAAHGWPGWRLLTVTLVGGSLAAGSANSLNCYVDRDIDSVMNRTANRPLVTAAVPPNRALVFGAVLAVLATGTLSWGANLLAAALATAAIAFYVLVYTLGLKRRTSQNIVWGGAAGCAPVLVGWAAVTGRISLAPVILFAIVFFWTPPHFWALALRFREDYARAGVPMLPVVASDRTVTRAMAGYTVATVAVSLLLWPVAGTGWLYPVAATTLGAWFLQGALGLHRQTARTGLDRKAAMRLFHRSISYLTLLFVALAVDVLAGRWLR